MATTYSGHFSPLTQERYLVIVVRFDFNLQGLAKFCCEGYGVSFFQKYLVVSINAG